MLLDQFTLEIVDAEALVDDRAPRVVDARHHARHAEALARDARAHDVGVVAARDRGVGVGALDARLHQRVSVEDLAGDAPAADVAARCGERLLAAVDDRHRVASLLEHGGEVPPHAPISSDDDVHACSRMSWRDVPPRE